MTNTDRRSSLAQPRPHVVLDVDCDGGVFFLVLANVGDQIAYAVKVGFSDRLLGAGGTLKVSELGIFRGLPLLRPAKEIRVFLDSAPLFFQRDAGTRFEASVSYSDGDGATYEETFRHDLGIYRDLPERVGP